MRLMKCPKEVNKKMLGLMQVGCQIANLKYKPIEFKGAEIHYGQYGYIVAKENRAFVSLLNEISGEQINGINTDIATGVSLLLGHVVQRMLWFELSQIQQKKEHNKSKIPMVDVFLNEEKDDV